ncbi:MAG TPA: Gfo/Idh/MocA family oxidoreductase [Polyangia bacterium]
MADDLSRRDFAKASAGALLAATARPVGAAAVLEKPAGKKRYAVVGVGSRAYLYLDAIQTTHADKAELVGVCDVNAGRLELARAHARKAGRPEPRAYPAAAFDRMIAECRPDAVIVTTVDATHADYICRAMELGCDVITEKPMTTEAPMCQRIVDTRAKTKRHCRVAFNYRYMPARSQLKELLVGGVIGDVLSVDFHWMLDTHHGADYFRRWHSQKRNSGGLMVHKATHHFDLVNWWLSAIPVSVRASGRRGFYTPAMAKRFGLAGPHERCHGCPERQKCAFELDLAKDPNLKALYLDQEKHDGYLRDRCVFRPDIDIEDSMNVVVTYDSDAILCYSVNAFAAWEGYEITFNGTKGRIEHKVIESVAAPFGSANVPGQAKDYDVSLRVFPLRKPPTTVALRAGTGGHGGGDAVMLADLFAPAPGADPLLRAADERSGAYAMLVGAAANRCFATGEAVRIADLVHGLAAPNYPRMPSRTAPLPMPAKV